MEEKGKGADIFSTPVDLPSREEEMRDSFLEELPSREEDGMEMGEQCGDKQKELTWEEEGERGEEKMNIGGLRGVEKNQRRDSCGPDSPPHMRNSFRSGRTWNCMVRRWENSERKMFQNPTDRRNKGVPQKLNILNVFTQNLRQNSSECSFLISGFCLRA